MSFAFAPRTLFGRNLGLIVALIVVGQLVNAVVYGELLLGLGLAVLVAGWPETVCATTVDRQCGSGLIALAAAAKQIALHIETAPELPMALSGEPIYLERALSALVDNAIKFTPAGSVTIRVDPGNIILGEQQRRMFIRFSVADTGPGLPPELQGRNFQAFTQGNGASTRSHGFTT